MTSVLHLPGRADAPIACDMSTAPDTPDERLAEYSRLFESALTRREREQLTVVFAFRAAPGIRERVESLARREAACCPFMDYRVETTDDEVIFTITASERAEMNVVLDAFHALGPGVCQQQSSSHDSVTA